MDVELPDGQRFEHHVVRMAPVAAAVVVDDQARVLLLWRHRFITDTWAWEIPTGIVEAGETPQETAAREVEEDTGSITPAALLIGQAALFRHGGRWLIYEVLAQVAAERASLTRYASGSAGQLVFVLDRRALS